MCQRETGYAVTPGPGHGPMFGRIPLYAEPVWPFPSHGGIQRHLGAAAYPKAAQQWVQGILVKNLLVPPVRHMPPGRTGLVDGDGTGLRVPNTFNFCAVESKVHLDDQFGPGRKS